MRRDYVSISSVNTYTNCARAYWFKYHTDLDGAKQDTRAMDVGWLVHGAIEQGLLYGIPDGKYWLENQRGGDYTDGIINEAANVYRAYMLDLIDELGISRALSLEENFTTVLPNSITVKGVIDAYVRLHDGRYALLDWKVRRYAVPGDVVNMDYQLYVYAWYLKRIGKPVDVAAQVQLTTYRLPEIPALRNGKLYTRYKTTERIARQAAAYYDIPYHDNDKVVPVSDFIQVSEIDLDRIDEMVFRFSNVCKAMMNDSDYLATHNTQACKYCPFKPICI